jgi:hypothetical protein
MRARTTKHTKNVLNHEGREGHEVLKSILRVLRGLNVIVRFVISRVATFVVSDRWPAICVASIIRA